MTDASTSSPYSRASKRQRMLRYRSSSTASSFSDKSTGTPPTSQSPTPLTSSSSSSPPPRLHRFLSWCRTSNISIHPFLDLRFTGDSISWSISIHALSIIPADHVIATIPKTAVLSRKTSALSPLLKGQYLSDSHETVGLELALCLLYERCLGRRSRFEPFISILPLQPVPLPLLRTTRWLTGTEAARIATRASLSYHLSTHACFPYTHDYGMCKQKALEYFHSVAVPVLSRSKLFDSVQKQHLDGLEGAFLTAYTHVSSRDFIVDTYHGVGLVPVADLFNHAEANTVQFESDQDVCEGCGVADVVGHADGVGCPVETGEDDDEVDDDDNVDAEDNEGDREEVEEEEEEEGQEEEDREEADTDEQDDAPDAADEAASHSSARHPDHEDDEDDTFDHQDTLDMRTLTSFAPGEEMHNTYGPLSNALLLTRYGFCLDTETDFERFTIDLRFPEERWTFFSAFLSHSSRFETVDDVATAFEEVLSLVSARFPQVDEDNETDPEADETLLAEAHAIDALHQLSTLLPSPQPEWLASMLCDLFHPSTAPDLDLVERDAIHPLFVSPTGRISTPLFLLTFLLHAPSTLDITPSLLTPNNKTVRRTFTTLQTLLTTRLSTLYISSHLPQALDLLASPTPHIEKSHIQHAYQEHHALTTALSTLHDLIAS